MCATSMIMHGTVMGWASGGLVLVMVLGMAIGGGAAAEAACTEVYRYPPSPNPLSNPSPYCSVMH